MAAAEKQALPERDPSNGLLTWIDQRFPLMETLRSQSHRVLRAEEFSIFWYYFGSLALFVLVIQIVTGIFPHHELQARCEPGVRLGRVHHARGALGLVESATCTRPAPHSSSSASTCNMFRAMLYGSYRKPRGASVDLRHADFSCA